MPRQPAARQQRRRRPAQPAPATSARRRPPPLPPLHAATVASLRGISHAALTAARRELAADRASILKTGISLRVLSHGGSNAIAVAPWRSADHHALLWGAPQEGFGTPSVDGEEYLHGPGYDAGGMAITGEPFVLIGRNADIAWTTTSEENCRPAHLRRGRQLRRQPADLPVRRQAGPDAGHQREDPGGRTGAASRSRCYRTIDGPVFSPIPADDLAFSMRFASWNRETGTLAGFSQLGGDRNLGQFRHSMSLVTTLHNFLYADRQGNIAYFGDGLVPIEPASPRSTPGCPALGNGTEQWQGFVPFKDMPHSVNPQQGFLDNWNTKPSQADYLPAERGRRVLGHDLPVFADQRAAAVQQAHHDRLPGADRARDRHDRQRRQHPAGRAVLHPVPAARL